MFFWKVRRLVGVGIDILGYLLIRLSAPEICRSIDPVCNDDSPTNGYVAHSITTQGIVHASQLCSLADRVLVDIWKQGVQIEVS